MAVPFIFVIITIVYLFLIISLFIKDNTIMILSSLALMIIGLYILIFKVENINNILTLGLGVSSLGIGMYISIRLHLDDIVRLYNELGGN